MPDDGVIQIGTQVDLGPLKSGMDEFETVTKAALQQVAVAQNAAKQASKDYQQVEAQFGSIAANNAQAAAILGEEYGRQRVAVQELKIAKQNLLDVEAYYTAVLSTETVELEADTVAKTEMAAATNFAALAQENLAEASSHTVGQVAAASGAIRVFEGNLPIRAVERFAVTTLGLGPILQAAFPLIGAIALIEILAKVGEEIHKAYLAATELSTNIATSWEKATDAVRLANNEMLVTNDRIENSIAKLEHRPENSLRLELDEASVSADKLSNALQRDVNEVNKLLNEKGNSAGFFAQLLGKPSTDASKQAITAVNDQIHQVRESYKAVTQDAIASGNKENIAQVRDQELAALQAVYDKHTPGIVSRLADLRHAQEVYTESKGLFGADQSGNIALLSGGLEAFRDQQEQIGSAYRETNLKQQESEAQVASQHQKLIQESGRKAAAARREAAREQLTAWEEDLAEQKLDGALSVTEELNFWQRKLASLNSGSLNYKAVLQKTAADLSRLRKEVETDLKQFDKENAAGALGSNQFSQSIQGGQSGEDSYVNSIFKEFRKDLDRSGKDNITAIKDQFDEQFRAIDDGFKRSEQRVKDRAQLGLISPKDEQAQLTKLHTDDYQQQSAQLKGRLDNTDDPKQYEALLKQKQQLDQKYAILHQQDTTKSLLLDEQKYKQFFTSLNQGMQTALNGWLQGTQTLGQAFGKMFDSIIVSLIDFVEQWLLKKAEMWVLDKLFGEQAQAQEAATTSATNVIEGASYAAVAGANALAQTADPAYAAAIYGIGLTFASLAAFEKGGVVGGQYGTAVPILAHAGERVLTAQQTQAFDRTLGSGGKGGDTHFHFNPTISGPNHAELSRKLYREFKVSVMRDIRLSNA